MSAPMTSLALIRKLTGRVHSGSLRLFLVMRTLLLVLAFAVAGCSQHTVSRPEQTTMPLMKPISTLQKVSNLTYSPPGWSEALQGDVHRPANEQTYPGVLLIHGGGWASRSRQDTNKLAEQIAARGYVVFNISHRFAPEYKFPAQIHDIQRALRWFRDQAGEYRLDPDRVASWGYSSGAHLAAMLGTISAGSAIDSPHGGQQARVQAVVAGGTPADLRKYQQSRLVKNFLGVDHDKSFATYEAASPAYHVSPDDPPVFLYHGRLDALVRLNQAADFKTVLDDAGVPNELYVRTFQGHATAFLFDGAAVKKAIQFLDRWLKKTGE